MDTLQPVGPQEPGRGPGPWPHRLALGALLSSIPLVLFGGSVTTLGAGMAVEGWLVAEGHFMVLFPIEAWFRDTATFVEHTHRLFGVLVGLFAIGAVVATFLRDRRPLARWMTLLGLLAVCGQGTLGGFRVLENSPRLAFLHGALAQAVLTLLAAVVVLHSRGWRTAERSTVPPGAGAGWLGVVTLVAVYAQVFLGAWYRHELRPSPKDDAGLLLLAHLAAAFVVTVLVVLFALALRQRPEARLRKLAHALITLLGLQVLLGLSAWMGYRPDGVAPLEWLVSVAHVLGGGLLLATTAVGCMWIARLRRGGVSSPASREGVPARASLVMGDAR